jgi:hypothetical protein
MEKTQSFTYVSPLTGTQYLVVPKHSQRAYYQDGQQLWRAEVTYEVVLNGNPVQFALTKEGLEKAVAHFEGVDDGWYCLARD